MEKSLNLLLYIFQTNINNVLYIKCILTFIRYY